MGSKNTSKQRMPFRELVKNVEAHLLLVLVLAIPPAAVGSVAAHDLVGPSYAQSAAHYLRAQGYTVSSLRPVTGVVTRCHGRRSARLEAVVTKYELTMHLRMCAWDPSVLSGLHAYDHVAVLERTAD